MLITTDMPLETLAELANDAGEQAELIAKKAVTMAIAAGQALTAAKAQVPHGEWLAWLGKNWNYSPRTAADYMRVSNWQHAANLDDATSVRDALRMIADDPETPKQTRTAPPTAATVKVVKPERDNDPAPAPPTTRKTAKGSEVELVSPFSGDPYDINEQSPKTKSPVRSRFPLRPITDEEAEQIAHDWIGSHSLDATVDIWFGDDEPANKKAKALRKLADKYDPPKNGRPDSDDVLALMRTYTSDLEFVEKYGSRNETQLSHEAVEFVDHYTSNGWMVGKVSMKDWKAAAKKWIRGKNENGKGNTNGHANRGTVKAKPTGASVFG